MTSEMRGREVRRVSLTAEGEKRAREEAARFDQAREQTLQELTLQIKRLVSAGSANSALTLRGLSDDFPPTEQALFREALTQLLYEGQLVLGDDRELRLRSA
jgi:hypothetical protein